MQRLQVRAGDAEVSDALVGVEFLVEQPGGGGWGRHTFWVFPIMNVVSAKLGARIEAA